MGKTKIISVVKAVGRKLRIEEVRAGHRVRIRSVDRTGWSTSVAELDGVQADHLRDALSKCTGVATRDAALVNESKLGRLLRAAYARISPKCFNCGRIAIQIGEETLVSSPSVNDVTVRPTKWACDAHAGPKPLWKDLPDAKVLREIEAITGGL